MDTPHLPTTSVYSNRIVLMTAALAVLALALQQSSGTVRLLGRDVPITLPPAGPALSNQGVQFGDWKFATDADGTIVRRYLNDGGWGDLTDLAAKHPKSTLAKPYPIRVFILQYATLIESSPAGVVRQRRSSIDDSELNTILSSLATLKASIEAATEGAYDVRLEVSSDDDPVFGACDFADPVAQTVPTYTGADEASTTSFGPEYFRQSIAPRINDEKFDVDDGVYRGPFAAVYVIHAALSGGIEFARVDNTPMASLAYNRFTDMKASQALPVALFESWKRMVMLSAAAGSSKGMAGAVPIDALNIPSGPVWNALVAASLRDGQPHSVESVPLTSVDSLGTDQLPVVKESTDPCGVSRLGPSDSGQFEVPVGLADLALSAVKPEDATVVGWSVHPDGLGVVVKAPTNEAEAAVAKMKGSPSSEPSNSPAVVGTAVGAFECAKGEGPSGSPGLDVVLHGAAGRGYVTVAAGTPLAAVGDKQALSFSFRIANDENLALDFIGAKGEWLGTALLGGDAPGPEEVTGGLPVYDVSVPADDQWHSVTVPLERIAATASIVEVRLVPSYGGRYERLSRGQLKIGMSLPSVGALPPGWSPTTSSDAALALAAIKGTPTAEQVTDIQNGLKSGNATLRLTALSVLSRIKLPEAEQALIDLAQSSLVPVAGLATRALAFQDTDAAWSAIRQMAEHGPFDHNRRFAAEELALKPDPAMAASLNYLIAHSWSARLAGVKALGKIHSTSAAVILAAMLQTEIDPVVRLGIAQVADASIELVARRLLYAAVNDPYQWVRSACYKKLIDSPIKSIQDEALKGVRDEAVGVRIDLLRAMAAGAKEDYRPALRLAVTDPVARVRAAALRAFATLPGPVEPNEVKNVMEDQDPEVHKALLQLAKAKGFQVPVR